MRITALGHASYLIQSNNINILIDPVFGSTFENGESIPFPDRKIHVNQIPKIDAVFLSHFHDDHFDIQSLKIVGLETPIYCPKSAYHILFLKKEGFKNIKAISKFSPIKLESLTITPTPSDSPIHLEYGFILSVKGLYIWNQVDTVITPSILKQVSERVTSKFSLIFCPYQLLLEHAANWPQECEFPTRRYERLKMITRSFNTKYLIPSSSGLKSLDERMNYGLYPINILDFKKDLEKEHCSFKVHCGHPGEKFEIAEAEISFSDSSIVTCEKKGPVKHPFNPTKFKQSILKNHGLLTSHLNWRVFVQESLLKNLKDCRHRMWTNIITSNCTVFVRVLNGKDHYDFLILENGELTLKETHISEDWDIRFNYNALEINEFLSSKDLLLPFTGFYNKLKKDISILELMGFEPEKMIDGWIGWNPISAYRLENEYLLD